ncbi:MAG: glycosyltransferase family 61 protein [Candidatus Delongbacteria bacterium]|nr:glycosyltransferase family 61 protein [Candidatus Delongbacteria bacterium]
MFGYLLPAWSYIRTCKRAISNHAVFYFESCGPLMNQHLQELSRIEGFNLVILEENESPPDSVYYSYFCPQWDIALKNKSLETIRRWRLRSKLGLGVFVPHEIRDLLRLRRYCLDKFHFRSGDVKGWLLYRRSAPHPFYTSEHKGERIIFYGAGKRYIHNMDEIHEYLENEGIHVTIYDAGQDSLLAQGKKVNEVKGLIGIRGAEFANIFWMKENSTILMFLNPIAVENHGVRNLCELLNMKFIGIPVESNTPTVNPSDLKPLLNGQ